MSNIRKHNMEMGVKAGRALLQDGGEAREVLAAASTGTDPFDDPVESHGASGGAHPGLLGRVLLEFSKVVCSRLYARVGRQVGG